MKDWIERHWGDLLALYLIHLGLLLIWKANGNTDVSHVGESFILLGAGTLRFKGLEKLGVK
jgi:hypothetical protein